MITEYDALHLKLREANNQIAHLEHELESLKQDAGTEINDTIVRHKTRPTAADALATALEFVPAFLEHYAEADDYAIWYYGDNGKVTLGDLRKVDAALRQYREAGNG